VAERADTPPREFESSYFALESWGQVYEVIHGGGYPRETAESRMASGAVGGGGVVGHRILAPRVSRLAWQTEQRVQRMPRRMALVLRAHYGHRRTHEQISAELRCSPRTVRRVVEEAAAWLDGFDRAVRGV